jgi:hypothetical protein
MINKNRRTNKYEGSIEKTTKKKGKKKRIDSKAHLLTEGNSALL